MSDTAHNETEILLKKMEKQVSDVYLQASKEVKAKLDDYIRRFQVKDKLKQQALKDGKITKKEYQDWLTGQLMMEKRWREMLDTVATDYSNADKIARSIVYGYQPTVYALNHNYGTFQVEKGALVDTSYSLYDAQTVEKLFKDDKGDFIPAPGKKLRKEIDEGKVIAWNKQRVQSAMLQSIIQGESIGKIASRISYEVGDYDRKAMIRNARTITTGVENAGRVDSYKRANDMGIETQKQWLATLDSRTRHWHRELDGVAVDNDKPFENEYGEIMYPGDPTADPGNIYNCRCTLIACIKGFERDLSDLDLRRDEKLGDMTYEEWKAEKESTSDPITKQDDIERNIKGAYNNLYRSYDDKGPIFDKNTIAEGDYIGYMNSTDAVDETQDFDELKQYVEQKMSMTVDDSLEKLDFQSVREGVQGIEYIYNEFPQAQSAFVSIESSGGGLMASNYGGSISFNPLYYKDRNSAVEAHNSNGNSRYHPKGNNCFGSGAHEAGHLLEKAIIDKRNGGVTPYGQFQWNDCTIAREIVNTACKNAKTLPECKGKRKYDLINQISTYANEDESECLAEAICDYSLNGENAAPLSKEIWKLLKKELG